jgi:hypothetical protein
MAPICTLFASFDLFKLEIKGQGRVRGFLWPGSGAYFDHSADSWD